MKLVRSIPNLLIMIMIIVALMLILRVWNNPKINVPQKSISKQDFKTLVRNGDLLMTRSSNNLLSRLHSRFLGTPIAHVGIAIVFNELSENAKVYLFEGSAPRGAQLRSLDDYMNNGADCLWWSKLNTSDKLRKKITLVCEFFSESSYSWSFISDIPKLLLGLEVNVSENNETMSNSCGDLVAQVYKTAGLLKTSKTNWMPSDFIKPIQFKNATIEKPINIIY